VRPGGGSGPDGSCGAPPSGPMPGR
jgi:hypothetical protein